MLFPLVSLVAGGKTGRRKVNDRNNRNNRLWEADPSAQWLARVVFCETLRVFHARRNLWFGSYREQEGLGPVRLGASTTMTP